MEILMLKRLIFLFLVCMGLSAQAQSVSIKGEAKCHPGKEIGVWIEKDYISNVEENIKLDTISDDGRFTLTFDCESIRYVTFKIGNNVASMYVEPNANYSIKLGGVDTTTYINPHIENTIDLSIKLKSKTGINALTIDYDNRFDRFLTDSSTYTAFVKRTPKIVMREFKNNMLEYYSVVKKPFFQDYIRYSIGELESKINTSNDSLYLEYIAGKPVLYNNPEYFKFFNTFYKGYLQKRSLAEGGRQINTLIEEKCSFLGLKWALKKAPYLHNDTIRELVIIKCLSESYYDGSYFRDSVVSLLRKVELESTIAQNKQIARNVLKSFSKLKKGALAPYFELPDKNRVVRSIDEMTSLRKVYIGFFKTTNTKSLEHLKMFADLHRKYGQYIEFVSISLDDNISIFRTFCEQNPNYNWTLLYNDTGTKLTRDYEVYGLPSYYFINEKGAFINAEAKSPEQNVAADFYRIVKPVGRPQKGRQRVGAKRNY